jgi:hypothetical protein
MIENKRSSTRKRIGFYVDVYSFNEYLGLFQIRDINLDGAFIDNCAGRLYPSDVLDLLFHVEGDGERNPLHLKATVTRLSDDGVAVEFDYDIQEYRQLLNTISTYANDGHTRRMPGFWHVSSSVN